MELPQVSVPVTILTGFLGAGKTTLLNRLLQADHGLRVGVLVNDFGAINIDTQLVVGVEGETISLANGCICCTIRGDLLKTTLELLMRPDRPEYLIIEASGVSDPWAIVETFVLPELRPLVHVDGVITVVDALHARTTPHYDELIVNQIAAADIVVLSKADLVEEADMATIEAWVRKIVPRARILPARDGNVPYALLLGVGRYRLTLEPLAHAHADHEHHDGCGCDHDHHDHGDEFQTWSYTSTRPIQLKGLRNMLVMLPASIFRGKGVLFLAEAPHRRGIVQLVGTRVQVTLGEAWGERIPGTQLVLIGTPDSIDGADVAWALQLAEQPAPPAPAVPEEQQWQRSIPA